MTYGLLSGADAESFDIDEDTGQLKTKEEFNYEVVPAKTSYMVTVIATDDDAADPLKDDIDVTITVTDVNDAPEFASDAVTSLDVAENTAAGENIGDPFTATDDDTDDEVTYTLGGTDMASFAIDSMTGQLKTLAELDYEVVPSKTSYMVTVTATDDDAAAPLDTEISVTITITDVNEAAPEFASDAVTTREVAENTAVDMAIGDPFTATDADTADSLTYTLGGADAASFDIDEDTGQLKTKDELDYETKTSYMVTVIATDDAEAPLATEIDVTITVNDLNEAPEFASDAVTSYIKAG